MCGIIAYIGKKNALPILIQGLKSLEYRGYDSAGIALSKKEGVFVEKCAGRISALEKRVVTNESLYISPAHCGIGHCLSPETLVQLADGRVMQIQDLPEEVAVLSLDSDTLKFKSKIARVFRHNAPSTLLEISTPTSRICATEDHRMFVVENGKLIEKAARDIRPGNIVCFVKQLRVSGKKLSFAYHEPKRYWSITPEAVYIFKKAMKEKGLTPTMLSSLSNSSLGFIRHILRGDRNVEESTMRRLTATLAISFPLAGMRPIQSHHHGNFVILPQESSPEVMQILGYFLGDGHANERCIRWKDTRLDVLYHYRSLIERVFNLQGRVVSLKYSRVWLLEINSRELVLWLRRNILERRKRFYDDIGSLPDQELAAFLKGIFDAEGTVGIKAGQVRLAMNDGDLIGRIQQWLFRFGVISSLSSSKPNLKWRKPSFSFHLSFSSQDSIHSFQRYIGFTAEDKQRAVQYILSRKAQSRRTLSYYFVPFRKEEITPILHAVGIRGNLYRLFHGRGFPTTATLEKFFAALENKQNSSYLLSKLKQFFNSEVVFQPVKSIRKIPCNSQYVYDLEVPGSENFLANGILSHNSRWATHGVPTDINAHPHTDCKNEFFVVHNGIIENHNELREKLIKDGHKFSSETDTEVIAHLIENQNLKFKNQKLERLVLEILPLLKGTWALAIISAKEPDKIVVARHFSPLILGISRSGYFAASDASAILPYTKKVIYLNDGEVAVLTKSKFKILNTKTQKSIKRGITTLDWELPEARKEGWPHFMLKEIMETPEAIRNAMRGRVIAEKGLVKFGGLESVRSRLKNIKKINLVACGSAYYAAKVGEYWLEALAGLDAESEIASEFRYRTIPLDPKKDALLAISQSGETADTLAALNLAKEKRILTLGIVNVVGSSISRITDAGVYQYAGPEIAVATTKAFSSQLALLFMFSLWLGRFFRKISREKSKIFLQELAVIPDKIKLILDNAEKIKSISEKYAKYNNFFVLGRVFNNPIAYEGALKIKEITYAHAEGYGAGEMKHGPIAMVDENFVTIGISPQDSVYEKMLSNLQEIKARGGPIIAIATEWDDKIKTVADDIFYIPKTLEPLYPMLTVIPLQLFAYYMGVARGLDVDKPRNLAKSVTVE
jgi:glucosamine--fructose-6-phosphate aminotransferase (isomerizing)